MSHGSHLKQMLYWAAAIFALLVVGGVPVGTALTYGLFLACPLMMVWMMIGMDGNGHGHGGAGQDARHSDRDADAYVDAARPGQPRRDRH